MSDLSKTCSRLGNAAVALAMQARLGDLDGYFLQLQCCTKITILPVQLILTRQLHKRPLRLGDALLRLTCKRCNGAPESVWLTETHNRSANGGAAPGWSVQLVLSPATAERV